MPPVLVSSKDKWCCWPRRWWWKLCYCWPNTEEEKKGRHVVRQHEGRKGRSMLVRIETLNVGTIELPDRRKRGRTENIQGCSEGTGEACVTEEDGGIGWDGSRWPAVATSKGNSRIHPYITQVHHEAETYPCRHCVRSILHHESTKPNNKLKPYKEKTLCALLFLLQLYFIESRQHTIVC